MSASKSRVFIFCRPYLIPDFRENVAALADEYEFSYLTDGPRKGIRDTRQRFYERMDSASTLKGFSVEDELDVMERCRYLRNLPREQALKMLRAMASVLDEELEIHKPHVILAQMVDEYITHLLSKIAQLRGIVYVGYIYSYFPGYVQIVLHADGRPLKVRETTDAEVEQIWKKVSPQNFRQNYKQKNTYSKVQHLKLMLRYRVKQIAFSFLSWRDCDPLNMHYRSLPYIVERRRWRDLPSAREFYEEWHQATHTSKNRQNLPVVYLPLAYFPESSTDYWVLNKSLLDYEKKTLEMLALLSKDFTVLVKEHMHMLGGRNINFYRTINVIPNVISVPPTVNSNDVLAMSDAVVLGGGSVGIEAYVRGKPILTFCTTSSWFLASGARELDLSDMSSWATCIREEIASYVVPSESAKREFLRNCLDGALRLKKSGKMWPICEPQDIRRALNKAISQDDSHDVVEKVSFLG
ncbi:MAG: hypothetical protein HQ446_14520 [Polaromonas sp.]|nr:hypothetical protein [Polaromonas sp.]